MRQGDFTQTSFCHNSNTYFYNVTIYTFAFVKFDHSFVCIGMAAKCGVSRCLNIITTETKSLKRWLKPTHNRVISLIPLGL